MLTAYVVDTLNDVEALDGDVSLREAITAANSNTAGNDAAAGEADGDTITFDPTLAGGTIILGGTRLLISDDLEINGSAGGTDRITISGNAISQIFFINTIGAPGTESDVLLSELIVTNGNGDGPGGTGNGGGIIIGNGEAVTLNNVDVTNSTGTGNGGGISAGDGGLIINGGTFSGNSAATGGAIANNGGDLTIDLATIVGNSASADGGGIASLGATSTTTITNSTIGDFITESDVWSNSGAPAGNLIFAFVDTQNSTTGADAVLDVIADDGTTIIESDDDDGPDSTPAVAGAVVTQPGDVFYEVSSSADLEEITPYEIYTSIVSTALPIAEVEDNGTPVNATMIVEETLVTGDLATTADVDVFSIVVSAADSTLVVILDNNPEDDADLTDTVIEILTVDPVTMAETVLTTSMNDGFFDGSANAAIASGLAIGTYFIRITDGGSGADITYRFVAKLVTAADQMAETPNATTPLTATQFGQGNIVQAGGNTALRGGGIYSSGSLSISELTAITNNVATGAAATDGGGGIYNDGGSLTITDATVIANNAATGASGSGGGILHNGGTLSITASTINANTAMRAGGGIEINTVNAASTATLTTVTISDNVAGSAPGNGGGVHVSDAAADFASTFTITGGSVTGNIAASEGGGLWNDVGGTMTINGVNILGNTASGAAADQGGGGVFNNGGIVTIQNDGTTATVISNNLANGAAGSGGGILNDGGTLTITGATISANTAVRAGGGIEITTANARDSIATLTNVTISTNVVGSAPGNGGGVHVTDIAGGSASTFTITGGAVTGNSAASEGGGLWNDVSGSMTINGVTITGNTASGASADQGGGGVFNNGGLVIIQNNGTTATVISNNLANGAAGSGGGILNDGGTLMITSATISANTAVRAGGGIEVTTANARDSVATLTSVTLSANVVGSAPGNGGGVHVSDAAAGNASTFTITGSQVNGNSAAREGGGLWNDAGGTMTITNTTINGNTASGPAADDGGGGVFNNGGIVNVNSSTISNNNANGALGGGGGIFNLTGGTLTVSNSTLSGNLAATDGGGVFAQGTVAISNSTLTNNRADSGNVDAGSGGGIGHDNTGTVTLTSTIVAGNFEGTGTDASDISGAIVATSDFNLIGDDSGSTGLVTLNNLIGTSASPIDPLLAPLADNGGPTLTHALSALSPAIDAGSNPGALAFDQRGTGFPRTFGDQIDIGAFELQVDVLAQIVAVGSGTGIGANGETLQGFVSVFNSLSGVLLYSFQPFGNIDVGNVRTAIGELTGDDLLDVVVSFENGRDFGSIIAVIDGATQLVIQTGNLRPFQAFPALIGVNIAVADLNNDGLDDIIAGTEGDPGEAGAQVRVFDSAATQLIDPVGQFRTDNLFNFFAYDALVGVRVAAGDVTGDGVADIITGAGAGGGAHVRIFDGSVVQDQGQLGADIGMGMGGQGEAGVLGNFFPYPTFPNGIFVTAGDINGDNLIDVITGAGFGGGPQVRAFSGANLNGLTVLQSFFAYPRDFGGGVRVGTAFVNGDLIADIITIPGENGGSDLNAFSGVEGMLELDDPAFINTALTQGLVFGSQTGPNFFLGGAFVSGSAPTVLVPPPTPLRVASGETLGGDASALTQAELAPLVTAALVRLEAAGVSAAASQALANIEIRIEDLPDGLLGRVISGAIVLDSDAAGFGWFVDSSPFSDEEFSDGSSLNALDPAAVGRIDLLTVLLHEFGHQLGADHGDGLANPEDLMAETLPTGRRRLPSTEDLDQLFADSESLGEVLA